MTITVNPRLEVVWHTFYKYWSASINLLFRHSFPLFNIFQDVKNVLVIVTRYFGGIHLGSDRFKHINQAARNALDLGGFLEAMDTRKGIGRGKKHWIKYSYKLWNIHIYILIPSLSLDSKLRIKKSNILVSNPKKKKKHRRNSMFSSSNKIGWACK